ncbi:MAG: fibronectin type III domain-containing protein [Acidobacteriota bacterium]|nr:fibronectin type III domain-containing protein [Acidobacteriota bacterium]
MDDLRAERVADTVELHWTTPARTTDGLPMRGAVTAEICQLEAGGGECRVVQRQVTRPGASTLTLTLPEELRVDPVREVDYRVLLRNSAARTAGPSNPAAVAAGAAPRPLETVTVETARSGELLQWNPEPLTTRVVLERTEVGLTQPTPGAPHLELAGQPDAVVHLLAAGADGRQDGTLDTTVRLGHTYRYTAQRVRLVQVGGKTMEIRTVPSRPVTATYRDVFAPATPQGLVAVPGELRAAAGAAEQATIDLSWQPVTDADLAGYRVYRSAAGSRDQATRLNSTLIAGPAYSDAAVQPGQSYRYTVTAVDTAGNESPASDAVEQALPQP